VLDLKAKLAAAGLVSKEDIAKAEAARNRPRGGGGGKPTAPAAPRPPGLPVASLRGKPKGEIYDAVRRFVDKVRLDVVGVLPTEAAEAFHFPAPTGRIGRLTLEPDVAAQVRDGAAAIVSYMSNHGLAHAVVPAQGGREIADVMPLWLRVLAGDDRAGQTEKPPEKPADMPPR
jgi:hypothetical protein